MEIVHRLLSDVYVFKSPRYEDNRGWLSIPFELGGFGDLTDIEFEIWQTMISHSKKGVIRGLHYQATPYHTAKLVSCILGKVYDVVVNLRSQSPSFGQWVAIELSEDDDLMVYVPRGFAHGYASLTEGSEVIYYQDNEYSGEASRILAWDDPDIGISWPIENPILSERDQTQGVSWQDYKTDPDF